MSRSPSNCTTRQLRTVLLLCWGLVTGCLGPPKMKWEDHSAFRHCRPMIRAYPLRPAPPCQALHMCANEAILSDDQRDKLYRIIADNPDCEMP